MYVVITVQSPVLGDYSTISSLLQTVHRVHSEHNVPAYS